jgi:hypothetical protein
MNKKITILVIAAFVVVECAFILPKALHADYTMSIPSENACPISNSHFTLTSYLQGVRKDSLLLSFPYELYLDSANWCDILAIQKDIAVLNAFNPGERDKNQEVIYTALTNRLAERMEPSLKTYHPDSLLRILEWSNRFDDYKDLDTANARAYNAVSGFWLGFVANHLSAYAAKNSSLKYQFKFRYLEGICQSKQFMPSIGDSGFEKIVQDSIDSKWAYLFKRFWYGTGILFKLIVFFGLATTVYGYVCIITTHLKKIQK